MTFSSATESFDAAPTSSGSNRWDSKIHPGWDIGGNANGGYLLAIAGRTMARAAERPDVTTITAHYLRPGPAGPITIDTDVVKAGRRFSTVQATMSAEKPILSMLGTFTDLAANPAEQTMVLREAPEWGDPEDVPRVDATDSFPPPVMGQLDLRLHPEDNFYNGPSGTPQMRGWVRLNDDEPWDTFSLLLVSDIFPPTVFNANFSIGWVPTLELTVHVRNRPAPGWLRCEFTSRFVTGGFVEEDGLMWDCEGTLVAQSRQIALLPRAE